MTPARFLEMRMPAWERLEALLTLTRRGGVAALDDAEMHELARLYPAVAVDVARARIYAIDPRTQERINQLAIAAHGLLYRRRQRRALAAIGGFFRRDYPRLFRRQWACMALATALFVVPALGTYVTVRIEPSKAYLFIPANVDLVDRESGVSREDMSERFRVMPRQMLAADVLTNNISVAFRAFAFGITAGIGTCFVLMFNAMMLGAFAAHFANHYHAWDFYAFIVPHGFLEILAVVIAGAAGLRLGISLALPGKLTRGASLRAGAKVAVLMVLGTVPMFLVAGVVEGFVTPSHIADSVKITLGLVLGLTAIAYLLLVGRGGETGRENP